MDYTICYAQARNQTTHAHQLAMAVVYYSPLVFLYWYDKPVKYAQGEWPELEWFADCPTSWQETSALSGHIGEYVAVARRAQGRWFIGEMTNEAPRALELSLSFLGPGVWEATIYADPAPGPSEATARVSIRRVTVDADTRLLVELAANGGQAIRFERPNTVLQG